LDKPQRIEGINWAGGVVDEVADLKATAWAENIRPALDTRNPLDPEYKPWCWLIGVPDGFNHYYEMCQKVLRGELSDWKLYTWFSSDILAPDVIAAAKASMSPKQFRQEYEASFESAGNKIYEDYGAKNWVPTELQSSDEIMWMHDFNYTPLSSAIGVRRGDELHIVDEIVLTSAVARQAAQEFVERYSGHKHKKVVIYGDPAGRAGEPHGQRSNYIEIEELLMSAGWEVSRKVKLKAPSIKDRQNAVRAKILNANGGVSLFVNVAKCPYMHKGLATTQFKEGSAYLEQEGDYQHITTALGYCVDVEWPMYRQVKAIEVIDNPSLNYWQK
jgi:hypothetical protein